MEIFKQCLAVGAGGFLGALARFGFGRFIQGLIDHTFPVGTMLVNLTGCFILGFFFGFAGDRPLLIGDKIKLGVATGFVGAYTTFSTMMYDTSALSKRGEGWQAMANLALSLILGFWAVRLGDFLGRRI